MLNKPLIRKFQREGNGKKSQVGRMSKNRKTRPKCGLEIGLFRVQNTA